jgi:hypothetical protein
MFAATWPGWAAEVRTWRDSRRYGPAMTNRIAALAVVTVVLAAGCGGGSTPKPHPATTPSPCAMTLLQACQVLRANIVANGGSADRPTLNRLAQLAYTTPRSAAGKLGDDALAAEKDVGKDTWPLDAAILDHDCQSTGVVIPDG